MGTAIEWTNETWNPTTGCTEVSPGCDNCYARELAHGRLKDVYSKRPPEDLALRDDPFAVRLWPERLDKPCSWRDPRRVFVNSMSDLFHNHIPFEYIERVFTVMMKEDRHTYQVLTKRPWLAVKYWQRAYGRCLPIPSHIWMGTSIEHAEFLYRARHLSEVPAAIRFLSCEPLLGPLDLDLSGIHWVIVGGESGIHHRPMNLDHARDIRDQCQVAGVPFFFKQIGGRTPKAGGCELDGREWKEFPAIPETTPEEREP